MKDKDFQNFINIVKDMRNCQRDYFRTRSKKALQDSMILEKTVDAEIKRLNGDEKPEPKQLDLIGGE